MICRARETRHAVSSLMQLEVMDVRQKFLIRSLFYSRDVRSVTAYCLRAALGGTRGRGAAVCAAGWQLGIASGSNWCVALIGSTLSLQERSAIMNSVEHPGRTGTELTSRPS